MDCISKKKKPNNITKLHITHNNMSDRYKHHVKTWAERRQNRTERQSDDRLLWFFCVLEYSRIIFYSNTLE